MGFRKAADGASKMGTVKTGGNLVMVLLKRANQML
jgi:hypothetical protein